MRPYRWLVALEKGRVFNALRRRYWRRSGKPEIDWSAADYLESFVPGRTVADVGGMWGIDGGHSFLAERFGARRVVLVDTYKTDEYERKHKESDSSVEFVQADATSPDLVDKIGEVDVVWCFGVLYHLPSPYQLLQSLRQVCRETLLLESFTAPEVPGLHQVGFYVPYLSDKDRSMWNVKSGALALGVDTRFAPEQGDANNFWFLTPTSVRALLRTAGFEVSRVIPSPSGPLRHVFIASVAPAAPLDLE